MLVSIGIISLLMGMLIPVLDQLAGPRAVQCQSNLRQFGIVFENYADRCVGLLYSVCHGPYGHMRGAAVSRFE